MPGIPISTPRGGISAFTISWAAGRPLSSSQKSAHCFLQFAAFRISYTI